MEALRLDSLSGRITYFGQRILCPANWRAPARLWLFLFYRYSSEAESKLWGLDANKALLLHRKSLAPVKLHAGFADTRSISKTKFAFHCFEFDIKISRKNGKGEQHPSSHLCSSVLLHNHPSVSSKGLLYGGWTIQLQIFTFSIVILKLKIIVGSSPPVPPLHVSAVESMFAKLFPVYKTDGCEVVFIEKTESEQSMQTIGSWRDISDRPQTMRLSFCEYFVLLFCLSPIQCNQPHETSSSFDHIPML